MEYAIISWLAIAIYRISLFPFTNLSVVHNRSLKNSVLIETNTPLYLTDEERENPRKVLASYFSLFDLNDNRRLQRVLIFNLLGRSDEDLDLEGFTRNDLIFYHKEHERLLEAVCTIYLQSKWYFESQI